MNDEALVVRKDFLAWLMANNVSAQAAQDEMERRTAELAPAPGDGNLTFDAAQAKVCETMTRLDLWGDMLLIECHADDTALDVVRRMAREVVSDLLSDEYAEFATAVDNGYLQWCDAGKHYFDTDDDADRCDDCDDYQCAQHGDIQEYDEHDGDDYTASLCKRCAYTRAERERERLAEQAMDNRFDGD